MSILQYRPDNPRRVPDWRWQRAAEIVAGARQMRRRDDQLVRTAAKFRRLHDNCETERQQLALLDANPAIYGAYDIYNASDGAQEPRWELEARLLARESFDAIGTRMGTDPSVIEMYEKIFFDVISRLGARSIITHTVMGRAVQMGLAERQYDCLWKLFGYGAGSAILDAFIYKLGAPSVPETSDETSAFWNDQTKELIKMKGYLSALTMPVNWQTQQDILNLWCRMLEMEQQLGAGGAGSESMVENVRTLMEHLPFARHTPGVDGEAPPEQAKLEANGVRLRTNELLLVSVGETPKGLEETLRTAKFPERGS